MEYLLSYRKSVDDDVIEQTFNSQGELDSFIHKHVNCDTSFTSVTRIPEGGQLDAQTKTASTIPQKSSGD